MFVDERIYSLHAGQVPTFLKLYEEEGMECQVKIRSMISALIGHLLAYVTALISLT